jgi:hypothetical protein
MAQKGFRLDSVASEGVGGPEAGAIEYIYAKLLHQTQQDHYSISINQIGHDLREFICKVTAKQIHINIKYLTDSFATKSIEEKNRIRLDIIHMSMLRIAEKYKEYDVVKLEEIRETILKENFLFEFEVKRFKHPQKKGVVAKILVKPLVFSFEYFAVKELDDIETARILFYNGITTFFYLNKFFQKGKWQGDNKIILTGTDKIVETHIYLDEEKVEYINLTTYAKPPFFELMKAGISKEDREKYTKDWEHSLPPHMGGIVNLNTN